MIRLSLTFAAATLALAACSGPAPAPTGGNVLPAPDTYQDQVWELELVDGAVFSARPVRATAEFNRNGYSFNGACNSRRGNYVLGSAGMLVMTPGEMTEVACADPADARFFALVDAVAELRVTRAGLTLITVDGRELSFRPYS